MTRSACDFCKNAVHGAAVLGGRDAVSLSDKVLAHDIAGLPLIVDDQNVAVVAHSGAAPAAPHRRQHYNLSHKLTPASSAGLPSTDKSRNRIGGRADHYNGKNLRGRIAESIGTSKPRSRAYGPMLGRWLATPPLPRISGRTASPKPSRSAVSPSGWLGLAAGPSRDRLSRTDRALIDRARQCRRARNSAFARARCSASRPRTLSGRRGRPASSSLCCAVDSPPRARNSCS